MVTVSLGVTEPLEINSLAQYVAEPLVINLLAQYVAEPLVINSLVQYYTCYGIAWCD